MQYYIHTVTLGLLSLFYLTMALKKSRKNQKTCEHIGVNVHSFERHLTYGLQFTNVNILDFHPNFIQDKKTGKHIGWLFLQDKDNPETATMVFEDRVEFPVSDQVIYFNNEQSPSKLATVFLAAILTKNPFLPMCPKCQEGN